jgi:hypothetical protein
MIASQEFVLYLIMPDNSQTTPEIIEEAPEQFKFPVSHFIVGLILSCVGFLVITSLFANIVLNFDGTRDPNSLLPPVLAAYLVPELLIIGLLIWLANMSKKAGKPEYKSSYNTLIVVNIICFCMLCFVMSFVGC